MTNETPITDTSDSGNKISPVETSQAPSPQPDTPLHGPGGPEDWVSPTIESSAPQSSPDSAQVDSQQPVEETEFERSHKPFETAHTPHSGVISDDIARILGEIKMPERRDQKGIADTKKPPAPPATETKTTPANPGAEEMSDEMPSVTALRTLKDDMQYIVRRQKISVVHAAALEQDKKREPPKKAVDTPVRAAQKKRTSGILFAVALLFLLGGTALGGVYITKYKPAITPQQTFPSILFAEQTVAIPLQKNSPQAFKQYLAGGRTQMSGAQGSITRVVPTQTATSSDGAPIQIPASFQDFIAALGAQPPEDLLRALGSDFFFGFHEGDSNAPVLVITVTSYDRAFRGMLAWEKTINTDLSPLFADVPVFVLDQNGLPTARVFQDLVMRNVDVRALKDDSGAIVMYYSFPSPSLLLIAESPYTFTEVLNRLQAARKL